LLKLHVPEEDTTLRRCLRAYTILPKFCKNPDEKNEKAKQILKIIWTIRDSMKKKFGKSWAQFWIKQIPYSVTYSAVKDWMAGRASIPLIALKVLGDFGFEKEIEQVLSGVEYISTTTGDVVKIPNRIDSDIAYLAGLILGDGCLPVAYRRKNFDYKFCITSGDKEFLEQTKALIESCFETKTQKPFLAQKCTGYKSWELYKGSKPLYRFFNKIIGLPVGKKAEKAIIPESIKTLPADKKAAFLSGLIDSDIGKHGKGMGCTFRSKALVDDLIVFLAEFGITAKFYGTHYKNGKYVQHDFSIPKSQVKILKEFLEQNYLPKRADRLATINKRAGVE